MAGVNITGTQEQKRRLQAIRRAANRTVMSATMSYVQQVIQERTEQGQFLNGRNKKYSRKGWLYKINGDRRLRKYYISKLKGKKKSNARYVFLERGYEQYRELHGKQTAYVDLMYKGYKGGMIGNMNKITAQDKRGTLGFRSTWHAQKAYWLSVAGAGKNKVRYEFFGLSKKEKTAVFNEYDRNLTQQLKALGII